MNNCLLTASYTVPCKSIAGLQKLYLATFNPLTTYTYDSNNIIIGTTNFPSYFNIEIVRETGSYTTIGSFSDENGTAYYTKTLSFVLVGMQQSLIELIKILGKGNWSAIFVDQTGNTWLMDPKNKVTVTSSTPSLGKGYGDLYGCNISMVVKGDKPMYQMEDGLFPTGVSCPIVTTYSASYSPTDPENPSSPGFAQTLFYFTPQLNDDGTEVTYDISIYLTVSGTDYLLDSFTNINRGWESSPYYDQPFPWPFYAQYGTLLNFNGFIENQTYKYVLTAHGTNGVRTCDTRTYVYSSNCPLTSYTYTGSGENVSFTFFFTPIPTFEYNLVIYNGSSGFEVFNDTAITNGYVTPDIFEENYSYEYIIYPSNPSNDGCDRKELIAEI